MKILDVILEKVFDGFCSDIKNLDNDLELKNDLNLSQDSINLIISRAEVVLCTTINSNNLNSDYTLGNFKNLIKEAYSRKYTN